jgi:hypothetical protein
VTDRPTPLSERPVLAGIAALTGVAVVVGLLAGITVLMATKILGVEGGDVEASGSTPTAGETLYLPDPVETKAPEGPRITLDVDPEDLEATDEETVEDQEKDKKKKDEFTLRAGQDSVVAMQRIDLTGKYPKGNGAILRVQRKENGAWADFPVTVSVRDGSYSTYVITGQMGVTKFRVLDTDSGKKSNAVTVTIG